MKTAWWPLFLFFSLAVSCQTVPKDFHAEKSFALDKTDATYWGQYLDSEIKKRPRQSGFYPLQTGTDALAGRLESIRKAEKSLDVQYYIWHDDSIGKMMYHELLLAADKGVRVRLLLDDLNIGRYQELLVVLDTHPHIEVRLFNPLAHRKTRFLDIFRFSAINRRMHNKSLIADNQNVIIGGRNIGREYFTASPEENFGDYDVWCFGPVTKEASKSFDLFWNDRLAVPVWALNKRRVEASEFQKLREQLASARDLIVASDYFKQLKEAPLSKKLATGKVPLFWGNAVINSDSPAKIRGEQNNEKGSPLNTATALPIKSEKEIFIVSPYFIPGKEGVKYFELKVDRGVDVHVFTNSLASQDVGLVFSGYKKYRKGLLEAGVHLYEMKPRIKTRIKKTSMVASSGARLGLHGKVYIFDRKVMVVGSMNLDPRSVELNSEMGVIFESSELAGSFVNNTLQELPDTSYKVALKPDGKLLWQTREGGKDVQLFSEPEASVWKSFKSSFLSLFIPESLL